MQRLGLEAPQWGPLPEIHAGIHKNLRQAGIDRQVPVEMINDDGFAPAGESLSGDGHTTAPRGSDEASIGGSNIHTAHGEGMRLAAHRPEELFRLLGERNEQLLSNVNRRRTG